MSPLKIIMLMRLYSRMNPFDDMPQDEINAPAMKDAFSFFSEHGLLNECVSWDSVKNGRIGYPFLSRQGYQLVQSLCEFEP